MLSKEVRKLDEAGVIQVFRMRANNAYKLKKNTVPLIFLVATKKGLPPQYLKYQDLKKDFPLLLIDFFQKKLKITNFNQFPVSKEPGKDQACQTEKKEKKEQIKENKEIKEANKDPKQVFLKEKDSKQMNNIKDTREKQLLKQLVRERDEKEPSIKESFKTRQTTQSRPVRSCRYRNDPLRKREDFQIKQEFRDNARIDQEYQQMQQRQSLADEEQFKRKSYKKILDYDNMIQDLGLFNLVSPAVIPTSKSKTQVIFMNYHIPTRINFKQADREQYSSEEFKESEQSEFVLDQRGKEKRRREKLMREQQKLNKRRKFKKIKKKKKVNNRQN